MPKDIISVNNAFDMLSKGLMDQHLHDVGSFRNFVENIWAHSYDNPEYFKAWHVSLLTEDVEECLAEGLNYVAVLPRGHFKSTILGHAFSVWRLLKAPRDMSVLYLSYSDGMAKYHIAEINKIVARNPIIPEILINRNPKADFSARFYKNRQPMEIMHGGLFSFKRGMHVNGALIADDVLRDPDNPLNLGQIYKVEDHFLTESMFIPLREAPVIVLGTPMMPGDLLTKLQEDERFNSRVLPALDPVPGRRVLMPELYNEEWLLQQQKARPKAFASEFMLIPHLSTESYFEDSDITQCESPSLVNHSAYKAYEHKDTDQLFAGFDVGKKRHPSHLVIFRYNGKEVEQVHQSWLDGWSYSDQIEYLNTIADNFNLYRGYVDNTRGELEDRGLNNIWKSMSFTQKSKNTMAQVFEHYVHSGDLKLLVDERQRQQILCVNNDLKAPVTPLGHGDAFFSIAMALQAAFESIQYRVQSLGNVMDWFTDLDPDEQQKKDADPANAMHEKMIKALTSSVTMKDDDPLNWDGKMWTERTPEEKLTRLTQIRDLAPNPSCMESVCSPTFWVKARNLCLYCGHRG